MTEVSTSRRITAAPDLPRDLAAARLPLTDLGNAERWRLRFGDDFRFCDKIGWFMWDGRRWRLLSEEKDALPAEVMQSVFLTVRAIRNEAALIAALGCEDPEELDEEKLWRFQAWAMGKSTEGWAELERAIRFAFPSGPDGVPSADSDKAVADAVEFVANCETKDKAFETMPSKRKLWSDAIAAHAKASEASGKFGSIAKTARSFPGIAIQPEALDADRMAINVLNGTLRLKPNSRKRTEAEKQEWLARKRAAGPQARPGARSDAPEGRESEEIAGAEAPAWITKGWKMVREPHNRADLITKLCPVKYAPSAECPEWDAFIAKVQPDAIMRRFIHQWFGLSLTGDIGEQKMAFFYGSGRNGKGTAVEAVANIAGDYAGSIPIESFLDNGIKRRGDQATPDLARLPGVRFLRVSEPERGARLNEGLVKMVTGGDPVDARHLNKGFFTFLPDFKMTISGNHKPEIKDTSDGIWRRMQLVPWAVTVPREEVDKDLPAKLRAEASGIFNRLLEGLCDWRAAGLIEPDEVRMATAAYRDQSDELGRFLHDCCEIGDDLPNRPMRVAAKLLHDTYLAWCEQAGGASWKIGGFKKGMLDKGFVSKASDGMKWLGVALRDGISPEAIREGRWSGPETPEEAGRADTSNNGRNGDDYPTGDDPDWVPADDW